MLKRLKGSGVILACPAGLECIEALELHPQLVDGYGDAGDQLKNTFVSMHWANGTPIGLAVERNVLDS